MPGELVEALRLQRHRFQNHLQVISGWLQLGKPERAGAYLATLRQSREQEGQLFALADWRLLVLLLDKHALAESNGVTLIWQVESPLAGAAPELANWLAERFQLALDACLAQGAGSRMEISLWEAGERHLARVSAFGPDGSQLVSGGDWQQVFKPAPGDPAAPAQER